MPSSTMNRVIQRTLTNQYRRQNQTRSGVVKPVRAAQVNGAGSVSVAGQTLPASGMAAPARGQVGVQNAGRLSNAIYVPDRSASVVYTPGSIGGSGPGGGATYVAGDGIDIIGVTISTKVSEIIDSNSPFGVVSGNLALILRTPSGLIQDATGLAVDPKAAEGIGIDAGGVYVVRDPDGAIDVGVAGIKVKPKPNAAISVDSSGVGVVPRPNFGLAVGGSGIYILKPAVSGLILDSTGIRIGEGDGIDVLSTTVAVNASEIIDTAFGLTVSSNDIRINVTGNTGLLFLGGGALAMGTPSGLSVSSTTNHVTSTTHGHAVATTSDATTPTPFASILASNASGQLILSQLTLKGNLVFTGADRSILASNNLFLSPTQDLVLDPTGNVRIPIDQQIITDTYSDTVAGILGYRNWHIGGNVRGMKIGKMMVDELFARAFTYDEIRANRGSEFWGRSFGIVETAFQLPALAANVDVWFEEAPDLGTAKLFLPDNWLLARQVDIATGIVIMAVWFKVIDAGVNDYVTRQNVDVPNGVPVSRQQWRLQRRSGGTTGNWIRKGNVIVDFGRPNSEVAPGQGIIELTTLDINGGPFIQIDRFMSVISDVPQLRPLTRMGHLSGYAGLPAGLYGFATGNDGSLAYNGGAFSGILSDQTNGLRLFNVDYRLYDGSTLMAMMNKDTGLTFDFDISAGATLGRYVRWQDDLNAFDLQSSVSFGGYKDTGNNIGYLRVAGLAATDPKLLIRIEKGAVLEAAQLYFAQDSLSIDLGGTGGHLALGIGNSNTRLLVGGSIGNTATSNLHVRDTSGSVDSTTGIISEQTGIGDAVIQYYQSQIPLRIFTGIDNTDGFFKISAGTHLGDAPMQTINFTDRLVGINTSAPQSTLTLRTNAFNANSNTFAKLLQMNRMNSDTGAWYFMTENTSAPFNAILASGNSNMKFMGSFIDTFTNMMIIMAQSGDTRYGNIGVGINFVTPDSTFHVKDNTATTDYPNGLTIEQAGTGDARLSFLLSGVRRWTMGINNSFSDVFAIASDDNLDAPVFLITPAGNAGFGGNASFTPDGRLTVYDNSTSVAPTTGLVIQQSGTGDALLSFLLPAQQRWTMGIDNSASDEFIIAAGDFLSAPLARIRTNGDFYHYTTGQGVIIGLDNTTEGGIDLYNTDNSLGDVWLRMRVRSTPRWWTIGIDRSEGDALLFTLTNVLSLGSSPLAINRSGEMLIGGSTTAPLNTDAKVDIHAESQQILRGTNYGASTYYFLGRRTLGSKASPTAVANGSVLMAMGGIGYASSGWHTHVSAEIDFHATENYTSTGRGARIQAFVTKNGTTTRSLALELGQDREFYAPGAYAHVGPATANVTIDVNGWIRVTSSSERYKKDIETYRGDDGLFDRLRPVTYTPRNTVGEGSDRVYAGLIAEELDRSGGQLFVSYDDKGRPNNVMYDRLVVLTIAEVQMLKREIAELRGELELLKGEL